MDVIGGSAPSTCIFLGELVCSRGEEHGGNEGRINVFVFFMDCCQSMECYAVAAGSL